MYPNFRAGKTNQGRGVSAINAKQRNRRLSRLSGGGGVGPDASAWDNCPGKGGGAGGKHAADAGSGEGQNGDGRIDDTRLWKKLGFTRKRNGFDQRLGLNWQSWCCTRPAVSTATKHKPRSRLGIEDIWFLENSRCLSLSMCRN